MHSELSAQETEVGNKNHRPPTPTGRRLARGALTTYTSSIAHAAGWLSGLLTLSCVTEAGRKAPGQRARALRHTWTRCAVRHLLSWLLWARLKKKQLAKRKRSEAPEVRYVDE